MSQCLTHTHTHTHIYIYILVSRLVHSWLAYICNASLYNSLNTLNSKASYHTLHFNLRFRYWILLHIKIFSILFDKVSQQLLPPFKIEMIVRFIVYIPFWFRNETGSCRHQMTLDNMHVNQKLLCFLMWLSVITDG